MVPSVFRNGYTCVKVHCAYIIMIVRWRREVVEFSTKSTLPASSAESSSAARAMSDVHEQVVTPWDVQGSVSTDGKQLGIDYDKLIDQFGTRRVDSALLERFERLTGQKPHIMLRRGMFFSHRYVLLQS